MVHYRNQGRPVLLEAGLVVLVEDVSPGVDVDRAGRHGDEQHERELDHVADLHQHGGGDECQHGDEAVVFGVLSAALISWGEGGGRGGRRGGAVTGDWHTAELHRGEEERQNG